MKSKSHIKGFIFDMDGVLIDSMKYHYKSFSKIFDDLNIRLKPEEVYKREGQSSKEIFQQILQEKGVKMSEEKIKGLVDRRRNIFEDLEETKSYSEMQEIMPLLKEKYKLGVVSGSNKETVNKFISKEYENTFDAIVTGDDVENTKPDPEPFKKGSKILNLNENEIIVIENSPLGIKSVNKTKMTCIGVATYLPQKYLKEAKKTFKNHKELKIYLKNNFC